MYPKRHHHFFNAYDEKNNSPNDDDIEEEPPPTSFTLNRARTGHTQTRSHLHDIDIIEDDTCQYSNESVETLEHIVLYCRYLEVPLCLERITYDDLNVESFNEALWTHPKEMQQILTAMYDKGYRF